MNTNSELDKLDTNSELDKLTENNDDDDNNNNNNNNNNNTFKRIIFKILKVIFPILFPVSLIITPFFPQLSEWCFGEHGNVIIYSILIFSGVSFVNYTNNDNEPEDINSNMFFFTEVFGPFIILMSTVIAAVLLVMEFGLVLIKEIPESVPEPARPTVAFIILFRPDIVIVMIGGLFSIIGIIARTIGSFMDKDKPKRNYADEILKNLKNSFGGSIILTIILFIIFYICYVVFLKQSV